MWYGNVDSMFEQFSSGYYLGRLYVQAHDGSRAVLRESHHRRVREQLYGSAVESNAQIDRPSASAAETDEQPLVMRYCRQHFVVDGDETVPEETLAVPHEWLSERPDPLEPCEVFLAKADRARQLLQFAVGTEQVDSGDSDDVGGSGPPGSPFTPRSLGDVAEPGRRQ